MFLFGVVVVLLLLNLLIARFAKTFDLVYENVDANFKVAFARVVVEGCKKDLSPPPLNLVRDAADAVDALVMSALTCIRAPCQRCDAPALHVVSSQRNGPAANMSAPHPSMGARPAASQKLPSPRRLPAPHRVATHRRLPTHRKQMPLLRRLGIVTLASIAFARDAPDFDAAYEQIDDDREDDAATVLRAAEAVMAHEVEEYLAKALSEPQGELGTLTDQLVQFVTTRWYDVGREEQWRTDLTRQVGRVELVLGEVQAQLAALREAGTTEGAAPGGLAGFDLMPAPQSASFRATERAAHAHVGPRLDVITAELRAGQQKLRQEMLDMFEAVPQGHASRSTANSRSTAAAQSTAHSRSTAAAPPPESRTAAELAVTV